MPFKIRYLNGSPDYEALQAAKIIHYPLEKRDYKPFAQVRLCFAEDSLCMQLISFEVEYSPESELKTVFNFTPAVSNTMLSLSYFAQDIVSATVFDGKSETKLTKLGIPLPMVRPIQGEDLQGVYWGGNLKFPIASLKKLYPQLDLSPGRIITGNLYKICTAAPYVHYGCYYPADFSKSCFDPTQNGEFEIIHY